jgi:ribosomal protein S30
MKECDDMVEDKTVGKEKTQVPKEEQKQRKKCIPKKESYQKMNSRTLYKKYLLVNTLL